MSKIGILAYGSLIEKPGKEIGLLVRERIEGVTTPFFVEFARSSSYRGGAPTVVPVEDGGGSVQAIILVLDNALSVERAEDLLWRRETGNECSDNHYNPPRNPGPNSVIVTRLHSFYGVETVLYTYIGANIKKRTSEHLADLAIYSARGDAGASQKDGISYLISLKKQGIRTPLMADYEAAILAKTGATTLDDAFKKIRMGDA
jgi:cation transport regulator ChaC